MYFLLSDLDDRISDLEIGDLAYRPYGLVGLIVSEMGGVDLVEKTWNRGVLSGLLLRWVGQRRLKTKAPPPL